MQPILTWYKLKHLKQATQTVNTQTSHSKENVLWGPVTISCKCTVVHLLVTAVMTASYNSCNKPNAYNPHCIQLLIELTQMQCNEGISILAEASYNYVHYVQLQLLSVPGKGEWKSPFTCSSTSTMT